MNSKVSESNCFAVCGLHVVGGEVAVAERLTVDGGDGWYERLMVLGRSQKLRCLVVAETWHNKGAGALERWSVEYRKENEGNYYQRGKETKAGQGVKTCREVVGPAKE